MLEIVLDYFLAKRLGCSKPAKQIKTLLVESGYGK